MNPLGVACPLASFCHELHITPCLRNGKDGVCPMLCSLALDSPGECEVLWHGNPFAMYCTHICALHQFTCANCRYRSCRCTGVSPVSNAIFPFLATKKWYPLVVYARSPRIHRASCMSLGKMVTLLARIAHNTVSSINQVKYASPASCVASNADPV